jgi:DNA-directed RNA polymerase omega subunit
MTAESQAPDSKFAFVVVAARRARQLMLGASPLVANPRSHKSTRVAIEELGAGVLEYQLPDPRAIRWTRKGSGARNSAPGIPCAWHSVFPAEWPPTKRPNWCASSSRKASMCRW